MSTGYLVQQLINATQVSAFYGLLAVSYVLLHAITGRINFAFGALGLIGGFTFINSAMWLLAEWPGMLVLPLAVAALGAIAHAMLAGIASERLVIRPVLGHSTLAVLVTTLGLALVLEELLRLANDSRERWLMPVAADPIKLGEAGGFVVHVTPIQIAAMLVAAVLCGGLLLGIRHHPFGRSWRACGEDLGMAELCGIDVALTLRITFAIASLYAAAAGVLFALIYGVASYSSGFVIGLKTLFVAVVGGLSSINGALLGAALLGVMETLWAAYVGPEWRDAASFLMLAALMVLFPRGLCGSDTERD